MTNHERYRRAAEFVRPSRKMNITHDMIYGMEMKIMKGNNYPVRKILAGVCASLALLLLLSSGAYAVNLGGFRRTVNIWLHGGLAEVSIEQVGDGHFQVTYPDGTVRGAGGMAEDGHGGMRGVTSDEITEYLNSADVEQDEDGRIWLYLRAHKIDITDQITEKGYAQEKIKDGILADYVTVTWFGEDGYALSTGKFGFPDPEKTE